jgi:hypothetical protein
VTLAQAQAEVSIMLRPTLVFLGGAVTAAPLVSALAIFIFGSLDLKFNEAIGTAFTIDLFAVVILAIAAGPFWFVVLAVNKLSARSAIWLRTHAFLCGLFYSFAVRSGLLIWEHVHR